MVERSSLTRRTHRNQLALPYARPNPRAAPQKSSWLSGFLNWIKSPPPKNDLDEDEEEEENVELSLPQTNPAAQALSERGHDILAAQDAASRPPLRDNQQQTFLAYPQYPPLAQTIAPPPRQQQQPIAGPSTSPHMDRSPTSPLSDKAAPTNNIEAVTAFLQTKRGPLNPMEVAGIVSLLQENTSNEDDEKREPFRFSASPSSRGTTPIFGGITASASAPTNGDRPKLKLLDKNPNGEYFWAGGGSSRRPRRRNPYQSAGFGPSRSQPGKLNLTPEKPTAETGKRRRVGEHAESSTSQRVAASAAPATDGAKPGDAGYPHKSPSPTHQPVASTSANGLAPPTTPTPRLRTTGLNKPTAPAVPSPLRQAWSQSSDSPPATRPTHAASVMTELIKEATPPKPPVFQNPYEARYPPSLKAAIKRAPKKKNRGEAKAKADAAKAASEKKAEEMKEKESELSPRKIIEATVPKGAKRARPPPELTTQKAEASTSDPAPRRSTRLKSPEPPSAPTTTSFDIFGAAAKEKTTPKKSHPSVSVEEVSDEDSPSPSKKPKTKPLAPSPLLPSAFPRPQDPMRTVSVEEIVDQNMETESTPVAHPSQVIEPSAEPSRRSQSPTSPATTPAANPFASTKGSFPMKSSAPKAPSKLRYSIQPEKDEAEEKRGQLSTIEEEATEGPKSSAEVKDWVKSLSKDELTSFTFDVPSATPGAGPSTLKAREDAKTAAPAELPTYALTFGAPKPSSSARVAFNWDAAGLKKPAESKGVWKCEVCGLDSPESAKEKCQVCEAPRPGAAPKAAPPAFNWEAAGLKKPTESKGVWKCGTCGLDSPESAKEKCATCETPRPGAAPKAAPQTFDWSAAGMAKPAEAKGVWKCGTCGLDSPESAKEKCQVCEAPRPGAAPAAPAAGGFNWAAAGIKQPSKAGWQCSMCACTSPEEATKCGVCDEPRS